jgi:DNA-binding transcriptional LysR family regulator
VVAPGLDWLKHSTIGRLFQEAGVLFRIIAQVERIGMMKSLVRAGTGIGFISMVGVEADVADRRLAWVPLRRGIIRPVTVSLLVRTGFVLPLHVGVFVDALKAELGALTRDTGGRRASALPVHDGAVT